jgi:hypothetical protein
MKPLENSEDELIGPKQVAIQMEYFSDLLVV